MSDIAGEVTVYLIPETDREPHEYIARYFKQMFCQGLFDWCTDESFWPADSSLLAFRMFFDVQVASVVMDLADRTLVRQNG